MYEYPHDEKMLNTKGPFNLVEKCATKTNRWKRQPDKFKSEIRSTLLRVKRVNCCNKLPKEVVDFLSVDVFKIKIRSLPERYPLAAHKLFFSQMQIPGLSTEVAG